MLQPKLFFGGLYSLSSDPYSNSSMETITAPNWSAVDTSEWYKLFKVKWVKCCNKAGQCCVTPLIFIGPGWEKILIHLSPGDNKGKLFFWVEIDGKVHDPFIKEGTNAENDANINVPRLGIDTSPIEKQKQRVGVISQNSDSHWFGVTDKMRNELGLFDSIAYNGVVFLHPSFTKCGDGERPLCFEQDGKEHVVTLKCVFIHPYPWNVAPNYHQVLEVTDVIKCEPCKPEIDVRTQPCGPPVRPGKLRKCCVTVTLKSNSGGLNGQGCVGGIDFGNRIAHVGRYFNGDDTQNLRSWRLPAPPLEAGATFTIDWDEAVRGELIVYDLCGGILERRKLSYLSYCEEPKERVSILERKLPKLA